MLSLFSFCFFFFKQKTAYEMRISDWSSDVCSSDLTWFYVLGCGIGVFIGPAQTASRSFMARVAPPDLRAEFFGLYALSGKATAFLGPALVGWITLSAGSQRAGMAPIQIGRASCRESVWQ